MQPKIAEVKYFSSESLDELSSLVTEKMISKDERWDFFGDLKYFDNKYVQTLIRIEMGE